MASCASDDITGKELPLHAVRKAREQELKYPRNLAVYERVDEREAIAKYRHPPIYTKWIDTDNALEGEPMQVRGRANANQIKNRCERVSRVMIDKICVQEPLHRKALKCIISIAASHTETFSTMHIDVSRAYFHTQAHLPSEQSSSVTDHQKA